MKQLTDKEQEIFELVEQYYISKNKLKCLEEEVSLLRDLILNKMDDGVCVIEDYIVEKEEKIRRSFDKESFIDKFGKDAYHSVCSTSHYQQLTIKKKYNYSI